MTPSKRIVKTVSTPTLVEEVIPTDDDHDMYVTSEETRYLTIDDERLDVLRPNPLLADSYVSRNMLNGKTDIEYLLTKWRKRENVLLVGDTQGGKTMLVNVLAIKIGEELGLGKPVPVFTLSASNGITDWDLFGQPTSWTDPETGKEHIVWLPGIADMAARIGGILYLDEVNMMPERVTSSLHPLTDWRRSFTNRAKAVKVPGDGFMPETVVASPNLWIVGTMNPGYRGAGALNEAFQNRFRHLDWSYDAAVERRLIPNEAVRTLGDALRTSRALGDIQTPIGTAALMRLAEDAIEDGVDMGLFTLVSMFTADEKPKVEEIIESRAFKGLIQNAVDRLHPLTGSGDGVLDPSSPF